MISHKVLALPQEIQSGDKVRVKGTISSGAEQFSINFANESCRNPENITYHFKWILADNVIVEDYKRDGVWIDHRETEYAAFDGANFALEFAFNEDGIYVYLMYDEGHNMITHYEPEFDFSDIQSIQVWDDVDKINELTFIYN